MVGVAVKVMLVPAHIGPDGLATIVTDGTGAGVIVIVIALDVAVVGEAQLALEVITTVTTSPLFSEVEEKVAPVPEFVPFTRH